MRLSATRGAVILSKDSVSNLTPLGTTWVVEGDIGNGLSAWHTVGETGHFLQVEQLPFPLCPVPGLLHVVQPEGEESSSLASWCWAVPSEAEVIFSFPRVDC